MTTEEKLKHFQDICMTDARERSARMLDDYMNALEAAFEEHLKDKLFVELRDKLANFMETQDYQRLLDRQVKAAKEFAGDEELIIYMDPSDVDKLQRIAMHHNATIKVSEYSFNGGTRAVLPGKHILIDNSFQTKLDEARHEFKFDLTGGRQSG